MTSSLLALGGVGVASAHRPVPPRATDVDVRLVCEGGGCQEVGHYGQRYVVGEYGHRYTISLTNRSGRWVEAVVTVDGRNIVDGQRASSRSRGYLVAPYESVEIEGWRVSTREVAAFRFTSVGDSYAGRVGDGHRAGTIRVEVYPERQRPTWIPPVDPYPYPDAPYWRDGEERAPSTEGAAPRKDGAGSAYRDEVRRRHDHGQHLGTQYGESRWQPVEERDFERASSSPSQTTTLHYDDYRGLVARGVLPARRYEDDHHRFVPPPPPREW
ncbi:MAG: hypothetical protein EP329_04065 [Deltaproteobacteria bacterium]|nr:MAG: hypothetical protein EP329_04065 [Deltaproteobacteria bacterium]